MKKLLTILLILVPIKSLAIGIEVLSNSEVNKLYGVKVELAEKSIQECNDFVVYAPLIFEFEDLGERELGRIDVAEYPSVPTIKAASSNIKLTEYEFELVGDSARALGCIRKKSLKETYFRFYYYSEGAPTILLVAPLIDDST